MIGIYYTEDLMQRWFIRNVQIAKAVLANFRRLNGLLDGFNGYENKSYRKTRNAVMFLCLPRVGNGIDHKQIEKLSILERTIGLFDVTGWNAKKLGHFRSRLASEDYIQSLSVVTELQVAFNMVDRFGKSNVDLYPKLTIGGFSDISIRMDGKSVYIEIGNLGESVPESKIQQILNVAAKHLGEKIDKICYMCLKVDTAELIFDNQGKIDVDASIKKLNSEIDYLELHKLAGFRGFFDLDDIAGIIVNEELYKKMKQWLPPYDQRLIDLLDNPTIREWLSCFNPAMLQKTKLVKGIISGKGKSTRLIEIHTEEFYPSKASTFELDSFLNHIVRNIKAQITEQQLQPNAPNIIMVKGFSWLLSLSLSDEINPLYKRLQMFFEETREHYLSGIIVFDENLNKAIYISNGHATESSKLTREDIANLGFRWFPFEGDESR
jgi:hypothetical protein